MMIPDRVLTQMMNRILFLALALGISTPVVSVADTAPDVLKVCADPYNLPYSNREKAGFENKIAELFASKLGVPLKYEWFPQRMGFIRNTLKSQGSDGEFKCDLVMGVPDRFELAATTKPYYASTYAFVYARGRGLDAVIQGGDIEDIPDEVKQQIRVGAFDRGPGQLWLFKHGLFSRMQPYRAQSGDLKVNPIDILDDIVANKVDATVIWGPIAGYYAKKNADVIDLAVIPLASGRDNPEMKFDYNIAMAVRYGEDEWKSRVNALIDSNLDEIHDILRDFGVPLIPIKPTLADDD